jgi:hypothetical protein
VTTPGPAWQAWAPPLDPPTPGGLPIDQAEEIGRGWGSTDEDHHLTAAIMWEAYAATLPPAAPVSSVQTGAQSVVYNPAVPGGDYGRAVSRAAWHRSFLTGLVSVPLVVAPVFDPGPVPWDVWEEDRPWP